MNGQPSYVLAIDQGTSSTKTLVFDAAGKPVARASEPLTTLYKDGGLVEQDPEEIYGNVLASIRKSLQDLESKGFDKAAIKACGISNQRETFVVWDAQTGKPLYNALVWQCKRSVQICERLKREGLEPLVRARTGLLIDPYFSGTKLMWLYENEPRIRQAIDKGTACFGTVDSWLLYRFTKGEGYLTDYTNASRTLFFNLEELAWDRELLERFGFPRLRLPQPRPSSSHFGYTDLNGSLPGPIAITALIGDSHAAAFGEGCFSPGTAKATLGTGCSIIMNTGAAVPLESRNGMVATICWSTEERIDYALEGVIVTCGATIEWLKNGLGLISDSRQTEVMAQSVPDNGGVYLVPAFSGLGAPHWDMKSKAAISGLNFGSSKNHIVRAALESIPYQIKDVVMAMNADAGIELQRLMVDGGITSNGFVLRFLADLLQREVVSIDMPDVSALGAAYLAGLKAGVYKGLDQLEGFSAGKNGLSPKPAESMHDWYAGWQRAVERCVEPARSLA
ncbi:MAG: glycerol kinase GlpK [Williamsia sp.]|nr:glycerol kinase GlpK [Williamsia sp.]